MLNYRNIVSFLIAISAIILSAASCSLWDEAECKDTGLYMTFSVDFSAPVTKTTGPEHDTLAEESYIEDITFYLVKQGVSECLKIQGSSAQWDPVAKKTGKIQIPSEKAGRYSVYAVANQSSSFTYSDSSASSLLSTTLQLSTADCTKLWEPDHFAMSSTNDTFKEDFMAEVELIVGQHTIDSPLVVKLTLDRLACKILPGMSSTCTHPFADLAVPGSTSTFYARSIALDGVSLINCVNSFNLFQHWAKGSQWVSGGTPDGYPEMLLVSPSSSPTYNTTAGYYNRWADFVNADFTVSSSVAFSAAGTPLYCLENNSPYYSAELAGSAYNDSYTARTKMKGRTTGVVFKFQVQFEEGTGGSGTVSPRTFYLYKGHYYADAPALLTACPELGSDSSVSVLRQKGVNVYENGNMYYVYWIMDENYTDAHSNYYSVIRNTCYVLNITSIEGPGDDVPGGHDYKETDPIDIDECPIKATLVIKDWDNRDITLVM